MQLNIRLLACMEEKKRKEHSMEANSTKLGHDLPPEEEEEGEIIDLEPVTTTSDTTVIGVRTNGNCDGGPSSAIKKQIVRKTADIKIEERGADFESFLLKDSILKGLKRANYHRPSPIQLKAIPLGRLGLDMVVQAKSGTGKTCVFTVLALEAVQPSNPATQVLIVAPTREIALQINETLTTIGHFLMDKKENEFTGTTERKDGIKIECFIGGTTLKTDRDKSRLQKCQIVVGTPGRIWQLINEGDLPLDAIRLFVLDEADKLMEESYQNDVNSIYAHLPKGKQLVVTSATYPRQLDEFLSRYMRTPQFVQLDPSDVQLLGVNQYLLVTEKEANKSATATQEGPEFESWLDKKIDQVNRILSRVLFNQCLIFCNYHDKVEEVCRKLVSAYKWPAASMSSNLNQNQRTSVLRRLKNVQIRILVTTDVMARGIDAENVNLVVNFDVPRDADTYFHRIGRAGRFGGYGSAITLLPNRTEQLRFYTLASEHNFHAKKLPGIDDVPSSLVENQAYFLDLPNLCIPDLEPLKKAADKRAAKYENSQHQKKFGGVGGERKENSASSKSAGARNKPPTIMMEGWDDYAKTMLTAEPVERWSPTEFVWEDKKRNGDLSGRRYGEQQHYRYSRSEMLSILRGNVASSSSTPQTSSRCSVASQAAAAAAAADQHPSPPPASTSAAESTVRGQRIDVSTLLSHFEKQKINESRGTIDRNVSAAYFPTKMPTAKPDDEFNYVDLVDDFVVSTDQPQRKNDEPPTIRKYDRDDLLAIKPRCVRSYAEKVFNVSNLIDTFQLSEKKKTKKKHHRKQRGEESEVKQQASVENQLSQEPIVDIRSDYNEAVSRAMSSPFHRFFGDCTLRLEQAASVAAAAVTSRKRGIDVESQTEPQSESGQSGFVAVAHQQARINVSYDHEQMITIWRSVANADWSHKNHAYSWIDVVKENGLLVERYAEPEPEPELQAWSAVEEHQDYVQGEEIWAGGEAAEGFDEEEDEEEMEDALEEEIRDLIAEYRDTLKQHNKMMRDYRKACRAYFED